MAFSVYAGCQMVQIFEKERIRPQYKRGEDKQFCFKEQGGANGAFSCRDRALIFSLTTWSIYSIIFLIVMNIKY